MAKNLKTISWNEGWNRDVSKFQELKAAKVPVKDSFLFQRQSVLMTRYDFENGESVIIPHDLFEDFLVKANTGE